MKTRRGVRLVASNEGVDNCDLAFGDEDSRTRGVVGRRGYASDLLGDIILRADDRSFMGEESEGEPDADSGFEFGFEFEFEPEPESGSPPGCDRDRDLERERLRDDG